MRILLADDDRTIRNRATKWIKREDIQEAIADKTAAIQTKQAITRETMLDRMEALVARAYNLPEGDPNRNERFGIQTEIKMIQETNKILGFNVTHHVHTAPNTLISFLDVDSDGNPIEDQPLRIEESKQEDPAQLDILFPSPHAEPYTAKEILDPDNEISMETDDDLPEDL